jgi:hypothetical protein
MAILNYVALIIIAVIGMSVLDEDRTRVSIEEWAIFAVIIFAAYKLVQEMIRLIRDSGEW